MPWLIPLATTALGTVAGAIGNKASATNRTYRDMANAGALEKRMWGGTEKYKKIDPELKRRLIARQLISDKASDEEAMNWWNDNKGMLSGDRQSGTLGNTTWQGQDAHDVFEDDFEDYWSGSKASETEQTRDLGKGLIEKDYDSLRSWVDAWGGDAEALKANKEVADARLANDDLSQMLARLRETGGLPDERDITAGTTAADKLFQGQRTALSQRFADQEVAYSRQAAAMGRDVTDPILQAKMRQEQTRQGALLSADQGAEAQRIAMALPGQRLNYQQALTDFKGGLAAQAFANRAAIMNVGMQLGGAEREWRFNSAPTVSEGTKTEGGGVAGAINGAMSGFGSGMGMVNSLSNLGAFGTTDLGSAGAYGKEGTGAWAGTHGVGPVANGQAYGQYLGGGSMGGTRMAMSSPVGPRTFSSASSYVPGRP